MRLITLLNHCEHFSGFVYEKARLCQHSRTIEIEMRPRRGSKPVCSGCHERGMAYDQLGLRRFEFVPVWGFIVLLLYRMRRVDCRACGVRVEQVPWATGKHQLTKAYMLFLAHWARKLSWQETAASFRSSWDKVRQAVEYVVEWGLAHRRLGPILAIGPVWQGAQVSDARLPDRAGMHAVAVGWQGTHGRELRAVLHPDRRALVGEDRIRLLGYVEAVSARHPRALQQCGAHSRSLPYRRQDEQGAR